MKKWYAKVEYTVAGIGSFDSSIEIGPLASKEDCEALMQLSIDDAKEVFGSNYQEKSVNVWQC